MGINGSIGLLNSWIFTSGIDYFITPNLSTELSIGSNIGSDMGLYYSFVVNTVRNKYLQVLISFCWVCTAV
jgi:hypothetical protein